MQTQDRYSSYPERMAIPQIIGMVGGPMLMVALLVWYIRRERTSQREVERAWVEFVTRRPGWRLDWAAKPFWMLHKYDATRYAMTGFVWGVPVEVELVHQKTHHTLVRVPIAVPADTPPGATLLEDALEPDARARWHQLRSLRPRAAIEVWPTLLPGRPPRRGEGHRISVGWVGRERDPAVLEAAIGLLLTLAARPPARLGPGTRFVPYYLRG